MQNTDGGSALTLHDHLPPQNLEAERSVIAGAILDNGQIDELSLIVAPRDFYRDAHQALWRGILTLHGNGHPVDAVSLADHLTRAGVYKAIGGDEMLAEICRSIPHSANSAFHAAIVREKSIGRRLIQTATEIIRDGYSGLMTAQELVESAERKVFAIAGDQATGETLDGAALCAEFMEAQARREQGEVEGLTTGLGGLDDALCGMRPGQLIILAARPGQGKTSLAINIAQHVTLARREPVLFVSLEMMRQEIAERWIAAAAMVDSKRVKNPRCLEINERIAISSAMDGMMESPFKIDDTPGQTLSRIAANARRHMAKGGLSLLIVDYLGYINGEGERGESNYQVVSRVSRGLKALAKELRLPLLVLHQLNRKSEDRADQRPRMADLRDSGQIEADADVVMLLHALAVEGQPTGAVECIIPKNRNGAPGVVNLSFNGPCTRFDMLMGVNNGVPY